MRDIESRCIALVVSSIMITDVRRLVFCPPLAFGNNYRGARTRDQDIDFGIGSGGKGCIDGYSVSYIVHDLFHERTRDGMECVGGAGSKDRNIIQ